MTRIPYVGAAALLVLLLSLAPQDLIAADVGCADTPRALNYWRPIRESATETMDPADDLALELVSCLASPSPELRDRIAYELFTYWLRNERLTDNTRRALLQIMGNTMTTRSTVETDSSVLGRSFSALILSEIMRSDSITRFMTMSERQDLLNWTLESLEHENDYRGLDAELGWVHPVAHMSDLLWRFALHEETTATQANSILEGIRSKVAPTEVFYGFNESDRLARVITTVITRELIPPEKVAAWIAGFEKPASMEKWSDAFSSPSGMAELHNTKLFLRALADQLEGANVSTAISKSLDELVQGFTQLI